MTRWVAFLRGVNVGTITVTSAALRECLTAAGLEEVRTVLATGNAVFSSPLPQPVLKTTIEDTLRTTFGYDAWIVLFDADMVRAAVEGCTLQRRPDWHTYVLLGSDDDVLTALLALAPSDEPVAAGPHVVYWQVPVGQTLKTPFSKVLARTTYRSTTTMRNLNTMQKVVAVL